MDGTDPTATRAVDVRRADQRFTTRIGWLDSKHSFSFGRHHDPSNTGHGLLLVDNDDIVHGGAGFDTHPHRDMEIVTWLLSGELEHRDVNDALARGGLVPIASGKGHDTAVSIHQRDAVLWGGRLTPGETVTVPDDRHVHVFVPVGSADLDRAERLGTGDAVRLTDAGSLDLTAGDSGAEVLIWATA